MAVLIYGGGRLIDERMPDIAELNRKPVVSDLVSDNLNNTAGKNATLSDEISDEANDDSNSDELSSDVKTEPVSEIEATESEIATESVIESVTESDISSNNLEIKNDNVINSDNIPYYNKTDVIGYITCESANLYNATITYGGDQWIIDNYDICMTQNYALSDYFGAGHPVFLAGYDNKSLSGLCNVSVGDIITIDTVYGANLIYQVSYSSVVYNSNNQTLLDITTQEPVVEFYGPSDVLQLYTCADNLGYDLNYKYFVKAELVQSTNIV